MGASGALKVLSTVDPATLRSSNRMEIIPQSDFNILTKIMPRNAKDMDVHHCAFWGNTYNDNNNKNNNNNNNNDFSRSKCLTLLAPYEFQGFLAATNIIVKPMIFQGFAQCAISSGTPWPPWFPCKPIFRPPTWRSQKTTSALSESGNGFAERSSHCVLIKTSPPQRGGVLSKCAENISHAQGPELICANRPL